MATQSGKVHHISRDLHKEMDNLKTAVVSLAGKVKKTSYDRGGEVVHKVMEHPVKALGIACGVGLILGMLLKK